jgi:very-short-patch-repair endonuclease
LIIELDGDQHSTIKNIKHDNIRTDFISSQGYKIIRIPNEYIHKHLDSVISHLKQVINGEIDANFYFKDKYHSPPPKNN